MANDSQSRTARRKQMKSSKKTKGTSKFKKIFMTLLTIGIVLMIGVGALFTYYAVSAPALDEEKLSDPFSSKVYDDDGELIADLAGDERRTKITYDDIPAVMEDAVLATEDVRFYDHIGIDFQRIGGAILANITGGFGAEGASTITQQVVKESFLTTEKTIKRKVQEQYLAIKLDQEYSKEEILEMYLNKIYYGAGAYGVAEAAETYFGKKDLNELTLPEAALLAGLPQRPSGYMPFENPDLAKDRMNTVLSLMVQHGKITEAEADEARNVEIEDMLIERQQEEATPYQAFIDKVAKEVEEKMDGADIYKDGLNIYTTLDTDTQDYVQQLLSDEGGISWPDDELETGLAVTDTKTGAVKAIGGGRNYQKEGFNFATDINRQPGSTFKPIAAYGPAVEYNKISTYHQLNDEQTDFGDWSPNNFDNQFRGWVSARYALSRSLNIPTIKLLQEVGVDKAQDFAEGLGVDFGEEGMSLNDAIGGGSTGMNPLQMAGAYAAFGNEGVYVEPYTVESVEIPGEGTIDLKPEPTSAMSSATAYMVSNMLQTTMSEGSGSAANVPNLTEAGKTGTTNIGDVANNSWFSGYTTNYSISIWTGYGEDNSRGLSDAARNIPKQIFKPLMTQISQGTDTADFTKPDSVAWVDVEEGSNPARLPSDYTPESRIVTELFHVDNQPSKVSQVFQKLDPVKGLSGQFNEESSTIDLSWNYGSSDGVTFRIAASINGSESRQLTTTKDTSVEITSIDPAATYEFSVVAISDNEEAENSDPATVRVQTPGSIGDEEPEEEPEETEENEENSDEEPPSDEQEPAEEESGESDENSAGEEGSGEESETTPEEEQENNQENENSEQNNEDNSNPDTNNGNSGGNSDEGGSEEQPPQEENDTELQQNEEDEEDEEE
ncbi:PBP1A family penicillin-binding protein [Halobacillus kuroshimensis]|uniref:PBP1A family penicillin-binding protein n=1 Tax=Halobacillus kuroshimensis TaxID=302481 RepID=A0ABS3DTI8_9BACI|nr:PBP1A family penicillin-binding protein [Halobacillus kuroshimensis]MBN8234646.1 PBP1A family penicillin-binding protein [Halobacillus kuroshimensis]